MNRPPHACPTGPATTTAGGIDTLLAAVPESLGCGFGEAVTVLRTPAALSMEQMVAALWLFDPMLFDPVELVTRPAVLRDLSSGAFRVHVDTAVASVGLVEAEIAAADWEKDPPRLGSYEEAWETAARRAIEAMLAAEAVAAGGTAPAPVPAGR